MGNEDRKVLKQNVASMLRDNEKEIEIHGGRQIHAMEK